MTSYMGGKFRLGKRIAGYINENIEIFQAQGHDVTYFEPFVGACHVTVHVGKSLFIDRARLDMHAADLNGELIALWQALQDGWTPPREVSEAMYYAIRDGEREASPALRAFVGIFCCYSGKHWSGYAHDHPEHNFIDERRRGLLRYTKRLHHVNFHHRPYHDTPVNPDRYTVIYCDPPYANTTGYKGAGEAFDSGAFWDWVQRTASPRCVVLVSEYVCPVPHRELFAIDHFNTVARIGLGDTFNSKTERLFAFGGDY